MRRAGTADPAEPLLASLAMLARLGSPTRVSTGRAGLLGRTARRPPVAPHWEGADAGHIGAGEFGHEAKPRARMSESAVDVAGSGSRARPLGRRHGIKPVQERVLEQTRSGGACVNATVMHVAVPDLPFGGVGASGMGNYHGKAGFDVFSHRKSVLVKPTRLDPKLAYPPYTKLKERIIRRFL